MPSTWLEAGSQADRKGLADGMLGSSSDEALAEPSLDPPSSSVLQLLELKWFGPLSAGSAGLGESSTSSGSGYHDSVGSLSRRRAPRAGQHSWGKACGKPEWDPLPPSKEPASKPHLQAGGKEPVCRPDSKASPVACGSTEQPHSNGTTSHSGSPSLDNRTVRNGLSRRGSVPAATTDADLGLGTWAKRQTRFWPASKQKEVAGAVPGQAASRVAPQPSTSSAAASPQAMTSGVAEAEGQAIPGSSGASDEEEDDGLRELAWKWRQRRRWQQEQAKQFDPSYGAEGDDDDGWDAALGYLDACGPGWHLQIARTTSVDKNLGYSLVSHGSDLSTLLLEESQREGTLREHADMDATRSLVSVARKARDLYEQQQQIEKQVEQRWCHAGRQEGADSWVGAHLQSVQIDASGKFTFILMKVWDRQGRNRLLIRGKAQSSEGQLVQRVSHEVMQVIAEQRLPNVMVTLLGSGIMEWSRERDRRLDVYQGRVVKGGDASIMSSMDVARLAGALTRASLPMHYHICVESVAVCG